MLLIRPPIEYRGADFFVSVTEYCAFESQSKEGENSQVVTLSVHHFTKRASSRRGHVGVNGDHNKPMMRYPLRHHPQDIQAMSKRWQGGWPQTDPGPGLLGPSVGEPNLVREPNDFAGALPTVLFSAYEPGPGVNMLLVLMFVRDLIE